MEQNQVATTQQITETDLVSHLTNMGLMKDLTDGEKNTYLQIAKAFNLNPFKREIYVSKYNGQMSIIVGYETYIKRAERSGMLDGWEVTTSGSVAPVLAESTLKAVITIYRKDRTRPFVWEAKFSEYMQLKDGRLNKFWQKSETMIKKVAMAQGFRLCFNDELGGMPYTSEEVMETEDIQHTVVATSTTPPAVATPPEPKPKKQATAKTMDNILPRIKQADGTVETALASVSFTEDQMKEIQGAKDFAKRKQDELIPLLENSTLESAALTDAANKVLMCVADTDFEDIKASLLIVQKAKP